MAYRRLQNDFFVDDVTGIKYEDRPGIGMVAVGDASGATLVADPNNPAGMMVTHFINVEPATAPVAGTSGAITYSAPVVNPTITSVYLTSGDVIALAATNWVIRVAIGSANDAAAAIALPTTFPTGAQTAVTGQVFSFNLKPVSLADTEAAGDLRLFQIYIDPIEIPVSGSGISRLDFAHNLAAGMTLVFGVTAVEVA